MVETFTHNTPIFYAYGNVTTQRLRINADVHTVSVLNWTGYIASRKIAHTIVKHPINNSANNETLLKV